MEKIAVVIPIYNTGDYICNCVNSILGQTVKAEIHIVLVNDGSTDKSGDICNEYQKNNSSITAIHKENGGAASARNKGIEWVISNGGFDYIAFIDSDDVIHPQMYEILLDMLHKSNADISSCMYNFIDSSQMPTFERINGDITEYEEIDCRKALENFSNYCTSVSLISPCMRLCKVSVFETLRFKEGYIEEDSMLLPYLWENAEKLVRTRQKLYYWTERTGSVTRQGFTTKSFDYIMVSYVRMKFFEKKGIKLQHRYFSKEFMNRCVKFYCNAKGDSKKEKAFLKYRKLYNKNWLKKYFLCGFSPREYLMHLLFLLHIPTAEKLYKGMNPDWCIR